jgi:hypothetical protein
MPEFYSGHSRHHVAHITALRKKEVLGFKISTEL